MERGEFARALARAGVVMGLRDISGTILPAATAGRSHSPFAGLCGMLLGIAAFALAGCGASGDPGSFLVDPGRYDAYRCNELAARWKVLVAREKELRGLMDKASEGGGGIVIGSLAYRTDYDAVLSDEKLLLRTAEEKNCGFNPSLQSDQIIR
jgi:hypothetical protein